MAQVPEKVLAWLYSVLQEYHDASRTYNDSARTLSAYPSLTPRTEVYTYETGAPALLLTLFGTIPVTFREKTYRFPVKIWIPHAYPREAPMCYVTPGQEMIVRAGQHVDVQGKIYHPYLRDWAGMWDQASVVGLVGILQQVFAKEPPVISKEQQRQVQRPLGAPPPPPPKQLSGTELSTSAPPPRPPKSGEEAPSRASPKDSGPPLPPLPVERPRSQVYSPLNQYTNQHSNGFISRPHPQIPRAPQSPLGHPNGQPNGPPAPPQQQPYRNYAANYMESPSSPLSTNQRFPNGPDVNAPHQQRMPQYQSHPAPPSMAPVPPHQQPEPHQHYRQGYQPQPYQSHQQYPPQARGQQLPPQKKQPPPDLLSDPFDVALPNSSASHGSTPAPPIPPNPEKEHLLQALSSAMVQQAQQKVDQNLSALAPLQAQQTAMRAAQGRLESELQQLDHLDKTLSSNEQILHRSIQDCDKTIQLAQQKKQPPIDEVLIAPTMVANQLWTLCAEEAACREAMYALQKAVDRGRIGGADFARQMRGLGRECFLKMALERKCARGMGLELGRR